MVDIVIRNATIIDGTGAPPVEADIAIENGRIAAVGKIASRGTELSRPDHPAGLSSTMRIICAAIAWLSRGRLTNRHDELVYVIRKPTDRFARVV